MNVQEQIRAHIDSLPEAKASELQNLHERIKSISPQSQLWFDEGKNAEGKVVTNPTIGYGLQRIQYANGKSRDFFQIGLSANKSGISVYILGLKDKNYLAQTYGPDLGKASVTGYCIKFKSIKDIKMSVLEAAIDYGLKVTAIS